MAKNIVKVTLDNELTAIGIVSNIPDFSLAAAINRKMNLKLFWIEDYILDLKSEQKVVKFSRYSHLTNDDELELLLISNKDDRDFLFKKINDIDYVLIGRTDQMFNHKLLREIEAVISTVLFETNALKGIDLIWEQANSMKLKNN